MEKINGGITAPKGFSASACAAGIKYEGRDDMALVVSDTPCAVAGVFTRNVVKAAPVVYDQALVRSGNAARAVVVNAGIANACTGDEGTRACEETARATAAALDVSPESVFVASTGVIGVQLPLDKVKQGAQTLARTTQETRDAAHRAARAIMTTDTRPKECAVAFTLGDATCQIGAMAKGSGMIHPNMGTLLCFLTTDVAIDRALLQTALAEAVADTLNMISVDGDTSTNDTALLFANGAAGNETIAEQNDDYRVFYDALFAVCKELAMALAGDGEGATKLLEATVDGAKTKERARALAKSVVCSNLTKAALYGRDANWGRILCALGYAGVDFAPDKVALTIASDAGELTLYKDGRPQPFHEDAAKAILSEETVRVFVVLQEGDETATAWGCDLTLDYVKINADYRS